MDIICSAHYEMYLQVIVKIILSPIQECFKKCFNLYLFAIQMQTIIKHDIYQYLWWLKQKIPEENMRMRKSKKKFRDMIWYVDLTII